MLATSVALGDIADVEGFVGACLVRSGIRFERDEHDELVAEGIAILYGLFDRFEPHRPGYASAGRFSGYAAQFLPRRLGDVWHRSHPEHRYVIGDDGRRTWRYLERTVSLDLILDAAEDGERSGRRGSIRQVRHLDGLPLVDA